MTDTAVPASSELHADRLLLREVLVSRHSEARGFTGFARPTVPIRLSRVPTVREKLLLEGPGVRRELADAGYGEVSLQVAAMDLHVLDATVAELDDGLLRLLRGVVEAVDDPQGSALAAETEELLDEQEFPS